MRFINIPLENNFFHTFCRLFLENNSAHFPNFSNFLIFTPSNEMALSLKKEFIAYNILMPLIIPFNKVDSFLPLANGSCVKTDIEGTEITDAKYHLLLFNIIQQHIPSFSENSVLAYIKDFIELENLILSNNLHLLDIINLKEEKFFNSSYILEFSLSTFFIIFYKWQNYKRENQVYTRYEKNILSLKALCKFLPTFNYESIYICGTLGTNAIQLDVLQAIAAHPRGKIIFSGLEKLIEESVKTPFNHLTQLLKILGIQHEEICFCPSLEEKGRMFFQVFDNLIFAAEEIANRILHVINLNATEKIGVICYDSKSAYFLESVLYEKGIEVNNIFVSSLFETEIFTLFSIFLNACFTGKDEYYIDLILNDLTIFESNSAISYKESLILKNFPVKRPYALPNLPDFNSFNNFLSIVISLFNDILNEKGKVLFKDIQRSIWDIADGAGDFYLNHTLSYINLLFYFAKSAKRQKKFEASSIFLLSPVEARFKSFDMIFIPDLNVNRSSENKIINTFLQKILKINANFKEIEWLDFGSLLYKAKEIIIGYNLFSIAGEKQEPSPFFLYAKVLYNLTLPPFFIKNMYKGVASLLPIPIFNKSILPLIIFVTQIEKLMQNPYNFYVSYILGLKEHMEIENDLKEKDIGNILHSALFRFFNKNISFISYVKQAFYKQSFPEIFIFYKNSLEKIENYFIEEKKSFAKQPFEKQLLEEKISFSFLCKNIEFELAAKPDRIDFYKEKIVIIDYKIQENPIMISEIEKGIKLQLLLQAIIVKKLYPSYSEQNIYLYYYIISLKTGNVIKQNIPFSSLSLIEENLKYLFENLKYFNYNLEDSYKNNALIARIYNFL